MVKRKADSLRFNEKMLREVFGSKKEELTMD
jgi:hypothetical protein